MADEKNKQTDENLPENKVNVEEIATLRKKVTVTIPRKSIEAKREEMFGELQESAQIPGFRIGHAPKRLIEKRFGKEISSDVRNSLVGDSIGKAIEDQKLKAIGEPDLKLDEIKLPEKGDFEYSFEVEVAPEFELCETKGIKVEKVKLEVTDEDISNYLDELRTMRAKYEDTDDAACDHDIVTASTKVTVEGCDPVEGDDRVLRAAPGQVEGIALTDLGKELEGKKSGDSVTINVTVPESHANEEWRNKPAAVEITVKKVRKRILPQLDNDFATQIGFESLDEVKEYVKGQMQTRHEQEEKNNLRQQIGDFLIENTKFELPEGLVARHTHSVLQRRYVELIRMGLPREMVDERITELQADATEQAQRDLRLQFILDKVADQLEIKISDADVNGVIASMAGQYGRRPERVRQELEANGNLEQIRISLREEAAVDKLLESAEIVEVAKKKAEKTEKKAPAKQTAKKTAKKSTKTSEKKDED